MESFEWVITELPRDEDGFGFVVASGDAPTKDEARLEMEHYAMQYSQDGPIEVQMFKIVRTEIKNYIVSA